MRVFKAVTVALAAAGFSALAGAGTVTIEGTRSNISPPGVMGGRCAPAITVNFGPTVHQAAGDSNLGAFGFTASHCIASPPPASYFDGVFEWVFGDGTLFGTHSGALTASSTAGEFDFVESLTFTGGSGRFDGATGFATATGTVTFGLFNGLPASFGDAVFSGQVTAAALPEPAPWALVLAAGAAAGLARRRRQS